MLSGLERRKFIRHDFAIRAAIKYFAGSSEDKICHGYLSNKSLSGLCMFTSQPIDIGEEIRLKKNFYIPFQKAEVRWIKEVKKQWYAVGLSGIS